MVYIQCASKIERFLFLEYMTMGFWFFKQTMTATATFEQLFRFGATFSPSSNFSDFVQLFSFLNNFLAFLRQFVTKNRPFKF